MTQAVARPAGHCAPGWNLIRLRRDGDHPLRFSGRLVARHDGAVPRATLWHEIGLYRTAAAGFAVEIVAQWIAPGGTAQPARCHAALFDTLDEALIRIETHDPARDICPGTAAPALRLDDPATPAATLMVQAAALHGLCRDITRRYRIGVGVLLAGIGLREV